MAHSYRFLLLAAVPQCTGALPAVPRTVSRCGTDATDEIDKSAFNVWRLTRLACLAAELRKRLRVAGHFHYSAQCCNSCYLSAPRGWGQHIAPPPAEAKSQNAVKTIQ